MTLNDDALHLEVRSQCEKLCKDHILSAAEQLKAILHFLAEGFMNNRSCSQKEILEQLQRLNLIDDRGKEPEKLYPLVRGAIGELRERISEYYRKHPEDQIVINLPPGTSRHGYLLTVERKGPTTKRSRYGFLYQEQLKEHWKRRAIGSGALFQGGRWYFTGRTQVLRQLVAWLSQSSSGGVARVITGDPGAGKSAVLGYLVTTSDAEEILDSNLAAFIETMPSGTVPRPGSVNFAINLRDYTLDAALDLLAEHFRSNRDEVVNVLANRQENTVLIFDALEEAAEPFQIAQQLLRPLTGYQRLWLIIGLRRPELSRLGESVVVLDLNSGQYQSDADLISYVRRLFFAEGENRLAPYRENFGGGRSAEMIARAAQGNFLIAFILARDLIERRTAGTAVSVNDPLPRTTEEAFAGYLARLGDRSGLGYGRVRRSLIPLAFAQGEGLPREVWALMTQEDVEGLLHLARAFVSEHHEEGRLVYRLYHQALAQALQSLEDEAEQHRFISERLIAAIPENNWLRAHWYTKKYLAAHAAKCSMLDALLPQTPFLGVAMPLQLLDVIDRASSDEAKRRANWYRLAAPRFRDADVAERLSYLELVAREQGAPDLAASTEFGVPKPWRAPWARFAPQRPHLAIQAYITEVRLIALNEALVASASYCKVHLWDLRTGRSLLSLDSEEKVTALAINDQIFAFATTAGVETWKLESTEFVAAFEIDHVEAIAIAGDFLVVARKGGIIERMDWRTGKFEEFPGQSYAGEEVCIAVHGETLVCGSAEEGMLRQWNLATGERLFQCRCNFEFKANLLAIGTDVAVYADWWTIRSTNFKNGQNFDGPEIGVPTCLAMTDIGAIGDVGGKIHFWRPEAGMAALDSFAAHQAAVTCLAIGEQKVASGGKDGFVRIWDRSSSWLGRPKPLAAEKSLYGNFVNCVQLLYGERFPPRSAAAADNPMPGGIIVAGRGDGTTTLLDQETGELWSEFPTPDPAINWHGGSYPDWTRTEVRSLAASEELLVAGFHWGVVTRSRQTGECLTTDLSQLAEDIKTIAHGDGFFVTLTESGRVNLWNSRTGDSLGDISEWRDREIECVAAAEEFVLCAKSNGQICFWDSRRKISLPMAILRKPTPGFEDSEIFRSPFAGTVTALACTKDVLAAMVSRGEVYLWSRATGSLLMEPYVAPFSYFVDDPQVVPDYVGSTRKAELHVSRALAMSNKWLVYSIQLSINVWDILAGRSVFQIRLSSPVNDVLIKDSSIFVACLDGILTFALPG